MISLRDDNDSLPPAPAPSHARKFAAALFAEGGWLHGGLQLEHRPQQEQMARATAAAFDADEVLLFEAGTGVGKSLAYLLPGIIHATDQSRQLIVSTHTISLQEQIESKDLPICRRVFRSQPALAPYADFKSAVLVGKANYLCPTRLATALRDKQELFASPEHSELQRIADWAATSREGLRHELNPPPLPEVWESVNADSSACSRKHCDGERCFYQRARTRVRGAQVIIVNHSLLFAHINAGGAREKGGARGILFPDDFLVLDEELDHPASENAAGFVDLLGGELRRLDDVGTVGPAPASQRRENANSNGVSLRSGDQWTGNRCRQGSNDGAACRLPLHGTAPCC